MRTIRGWRDQVTRTGGELARFANAHRLWLVAILGYATLAVVMLRGDFGAGSSALPQGTNALNTYTTYAFEQREGLTTWMAPYTDWGQPLPFYPGLDPANLAAITNLLSPTVYIRSVEFVAIVASGLSMCWAVQRLGGREGPTLVAGLFYLLLEQTPQFFEGHVPGMICLALAPLLFVLLYLFFQRPTLRVGVPLAVVLFLMGTIGDLGYLYKFLFFAIPIAAVLIVLAARRLPYRRREWTAFGLSASLLAILLAPWAATYLAGVRPELTTGITATSFPFSDTSGLNLYYAVIGFGGDNSFTNHYLHSFSYAWNLSTTGALFLVIPIAVGVWAVGFGSTKVRWFYLSGLLALVLSTGQKVPGLILVNQTFYNYVPLFSTDTALFHWNAYYVLVLSIMLGLALTRAVRWLTGPYALDRPSPEAVSSPDGVSRSTSPAGPWHPQRWGRLATEGIRARPRVAWVLAVVVLVGGAGLPLVQNWEAVSAPPTLFEFPASYTAGFQYVESQPARGAVLSVPFGNIYEETPWGGVSSSSQLFAGIQTGRNLGIFEAGTPYALALDQVIGDGLARGTSNNLTKFWNATGVQFAVSTQYPDWSYTGDPAYDAEDSYTGLLHQAGLGAPVFSRGYQSVYEVSHPAGNVSIFPQYYVYDGGESLLNEILNQPWYNGSQALICWCDVGSASATTVLGHATAFVAPPSALANLSSATWQELRLASTPVWAVLSNPDFAPATIEQYINLWNASNARDLGSRFSDTPAVSHPLPAALVSAGYGSADLTLRASGPPGAWFTINSTGGPPLNGTVGPALTPVQDLAYDNGSVVSAGSNPQSSLPSNGSLSFVNSDGTRYVEWTPGPNNSTYLALDFAYQNLTALTGISFTLRGPPLNASALELQLVLPVMTLTVPGYVSNVSTAGPSTTYSFYFPDAVAPTSAIVGFNPANISSYLKDVRRFALVLPDTEQRDQFLWSNLTGFANRSGLFDTIPAGTLPVEPGAPWKIATSPLVRIDTMSAQMGRLPSPSAPREDIYAPQADASDEQAAVATGGWYVVQLAQTYSSPWTLMGPVGSAVHLVVNVGLNGWLVNASGPVTLRLVYAGDAAALLGDALEGVGLVVFGVGVVVWRRWGRPAHGFGFLGRKARPSGAREGDP